jgi:hypothetical protein
LVSKKNWIASLQSSALAAVTGGKGQPSGQQKSRPLGNLHRGPLSPNLQFNDRVSNAAFAPTAAKPDDAIARRDFDPFADFGSGWLNRG